MKSIYISLIIIFSSFYISTAQSKDEKKCQKYYENKKFEKCIDYSKKHLKKDRSQIRLYYLQGLSLYALYQRDQNEKQLYKALKAVNKGKSRDDKHIVYSEFKDHWPGIQKETKIFAEKLHKSDSLDSRKYFLLLVEVFQDTTDGYREFYVEDDRPDKDIIKQMKAGKLNQKDNRGRKQGEWKKVYSNGITAYTATFKDNKPQGVIKRYHTNGRLMAELTFDHTGTFASAKLYNKKEELVSKGFYKNQKKDSLWKYYKNDFLIQTEHFTRGKLNGKRIAYYPDGTIYDEREMADDKENGIWKKYHPNGKAMLKAVVKNNLLAGTFLRYYYTGAIEVKGQYKNDIKVGTWEYYNEKGVKNSMDFKDGVAENAEEIEKKKSDEYEKQIRNRLKDPENFRNNPNGYLKGN